MRTWSSRFVAILFVLSMIAAPNATALASQSTDLPQSTPVLTDPVDPTEVPTDEVITPEEVQEETVVGTPEGGNENSNLGDIAPLAFDSSNVNFSTPYWDTATDSLRISWSVYANVTVEAGDTLTLNYPAENLILSETPHLIEDGDGRTIANVTVDQSTGTITITYPASRPYIDGDTHEFSIQGEPIVFPECRGSADGYENDVFLQYDTSVHGTTYQWVDGPSCEGNGLPEVSDMYFVPFAELFQVGLYVPGIPSAGHVITITYPTDLVEFGSEPVDFYLWSHTNDEEVKIATGIASNGVITITFLELDPQIEWDDWASAAFPAKLVNQSCIPADSPSFHEIGEIPFIPSAGAPYSAFIEGALCNAAAPTKSGAWSDDGERIIWTIDTGDIISPVIVQDFGATGDIEFDCGTLTVVSADPNFTYDDDCDPEYPYGFFLNLYGSDITRATITIESIPAPDPVMGSYLNCAFVVSDAGFEADMVSTADGNGLGAPVCAEVFLPDDGDFITKTVNKETVQSGESLTYTITASTTSNLWFSLDLTDELPVGFVVTSVTCAVTPAQFQTDPCSILSDGNVLAASAVNDWQSEEQPNGSGVSIVLEVEGYYEVTQDTVIENQACSERMINLFEGGIGVTRASMGDPEIFGGGVICASANVLVLAAEVAPTETVVPTETIVPATPATVIPTTPATVVPATPGATPAASPAATTATTVPADPTQTSAASSVTGLPATGNAASGMSNASMVIATLAAAMMMAAAVGIRVRSSRD